MINIIILVTHCLSQIIEVNQTENSIWIGEYTTSSINTYRIITNEQIKQFYYIQVELDEINPKFMLLAEKGKPISNPYSTDLIDGQNIDATNQNENRKIRFLKISSYFQQNIYITTRGNFEGQRYKISILKTTNPQKCQNNCSQNGVCDEQGCICSQNYTGVDCSYFATPIFDKISIIQQYVQEGYLTFYIPATSLQSQKYLLKFKTNNFYGFEILIYKTQAIINPLEEELKLNQNLCDVYEVKKDQDLELFLIISGVFLQRQRINIAISSGLPNYKFEDLEISLEEYVKNEKLNQLSDTVVIIIIVICGVLFLILIIVFYCCYRNYKRNQAQRLRIRENQGQNNRPITHQQIQLKEVSEKKNLVLLSSKEINPEEYCSICLEPLKSPLEVRQTECHHNFHTQCINLWLEKAKHECPICRQQLKFKAQNKIINT